MTSATRVVIETNRDTKHELVPRILFIEYKLSDDIIWFKVQ